MRTAIAGLVGGLVFFIWGAIAHMALGLGDAGVHYGGPHQTLLATMRAELATPGLHVVPSLPEASMADPEAVSRFASEVAGEGYAFIVYVPGGNPGMGDMGPNLGLQWLTDTIASLLLAFLLAGLPSRWAPRLLASVAVGAIVGLAAFVPLWNWYLFPAEFVAGNVAKHLLGWTLAGLAIHAVLRRRFAADSAARG